MKVLVLGATGMVGKPYVAEALGRGHIVTACARKPTSPDPAQENAIFGPLDVLAEPERLAALVAEHDATLSALRPIEGDEEALVTMTRAVLDAVQKTSRPVYVTGGAGPLLLADGSGHTVLSAPGFLPDSVRPIAEACERQDRLFDEFDQVDWVCLRPAAMLVEAQSTRRYGLGRNALVTQEDGISRISYADFAVAMLDLVELAPAPRQRLTVGW